MAVLCNGAKWFTKKLQKFHLNPHENLAYQQSFYKIVTTISNLKDNCNQFRYNSDINIQEIKKLDSYYDSNRSLMDCFTPNFWKMRGLRNKYLKNWDGTNGAFKSYLLMHDEILNFKSNQQNNSSPFIINELNPQSLLDAYSIILPMLQTMDDLNNVIVKLFPAVKEKFERLSIETCSEIVKLFETVIATKDQVNALEAKIIDMYEQLNFYFEIPHDFSFENNEVFENLLRTIIDIDSIDAIDLCLVKMNNVISKQMIIDKLLHIDLKWSQYIHDNVIKSWVDEIRSLYPELRTFDKNSFHKKIKQFVTLEDDHRNSARDFVNNTLFKRWNKGAGEFEGLSLLKKEANKRNKVIPPREILEKGAASTMFKLKPCWLMSPLSISQILPLEMGLFDTIIFDEASQVRVEDAIPAIYRANSMVVVGDMKQMPPTNFFSGSDSTDDDDEEETVELSSSILDLAAQIYPSEILEWHYRSRSEALIAYSNRAFYGGRLIAVPNPNYITEGDVIKFHIVNNAYFTQNDGNSTEAEAIVDRLSQLLKNEPNRSFGIIALGQTQMLAIEDAIERKRSSDLAFQKAIEKAENHMEGEVDAGLFVKNLENVQGDERDIIIISVGYAAANPNRKVYMNFGPLSKVGGGCRLNVAITRAKHKIEVFCSFDPNLISTEEADFSRNPDLVLFGRYLKYTKAISEKSHTEALSILNSFGIGGVITSRKSSNFSKNVKKRLEELGYQVSAEVGSSGFYIDLAIHHPVIQTNFVLGIECDGAIFHSTPYARDRDKIRQELLESRGWKIARVWSQDWSRNWQAEIAKLDLELKEIISS
jgi:superfamily I DNA and/or RNA helicase/very-short-patch-repair endonuclease